MKKILIIGSEGFTGPYLREELENNGYEVFRLGRKEIGAKKYFQCDINDKEKLNGIIHDLKPEWIFHIAAFEAPSKSFEEKDLCFKVTVEGTRNVLETSKGIVEKILIPSSAHLYGIPKYNPVDEEHPINPLPHPYAQAKYEQEKLALEYPNVIVARAFNYTGVRQSKDFVIPSFKERIKNAENGETLFVGNLDIVRDFSDVRDVMHAYRLIMEKGKLGEIYNVGSGIGYNLRKVLEKLIDNSGKDLKVEIDPEKFRPAEAQEIICDNTKVKKLGASFRKIF
jgi:GDP-4-dehydro-6-deoxy-D-mannose reductase